MILLPIVLRWAASQRFPKKLPKKEANGDDDAIATEQPTVPMPAEEPPPTAPSTPDISPALTTVPIAATVPASETPDPPLPGAGADIPWTIRQVGLSIGLVVGIFAVVLVAIGGFVATWDVSNTVATVIALLASAMLQAAMLGCVWYFAIRRSGGAWRELGFRRIRPLQAVIVGIIGVIAAYLAVAVYAAIVTGLGIEILIPNEFPEELGREPLSLMILAVTALAIAPFTEEVFFRGFAYQALRKRLSPVSAAVVSSGLFGIAHLGLGLVIPIALMGMILVAAFRRTGNLWSSIIIHAGFNAVSITGLAASAWAD